MATASPQLTASASPNHASQGADINSSQLHRRVYQACIPCRKRKVRCDLGPVDDPHDPPCVRCRRESKECFFSATRRKRRADGGEGDSLGEELPDDDPISAAHSIRRKSARTFKASSSIREPKLRHGRRSMTSVPLSAASPLDGYTGHRPFQQTAPYSTTINPPEREQDGQGQQVTNETAAALFQSPINVPGDALHLLLKASDESEHIQRKATANLGNQLLQETHRDAFETQGNYDPDGVHPSQRRLGELHGSNLDPAIIAHNAEGAVAPISREALKIWSRLKFVRAGWFTAREAISYIDYFYKYLSPLTPISLPAFDAKSAYSVLLNDEPMLTVTVLTISSRYMKLPGLAGQTRSFMIHERLWSYLQNMITRMFWGQEQFGGGFCGAGIGRLGQQGKGGLRTFGTIESLLLLNEFHPRSMHFPPRDDDDDILVSAEDEATPVLSGGEPRFVGWSEPAQRSDRMCWSLIGFSYILAYELGIFGTYSEGVRSVNVRVKREDRSSGSHTLIQRADRIERLLYIYVTQASGRFGLPSLYQDRVNNSDVDSVTEGLSSANSITLPVDKTQQSWVDLMSIMKACNDELFTSKDQTTKLIQSGDYIGRLQRLQPLLHEWEKKTNSLEIPKYPMLVLSIEYHYISLYINSLALQAVLEQWTAKVNAIPQGESPRSPGSTISSSFATLYSWNERYITEVIDSSRTVLRHVVDGLLPDDYLKHVPVRTYFRILSAAMFLLKTFALGGKEDEVSISLRLLDATVGALRTSVVDDVHLCLRIADLLEVLTSSIRPKFVRLPPRPLSTPEQAKRATNLEQSQEHYNSNNFQNSNQPLSPLQGISRTYNNPHDSSITFMPPWGSDYIDSSYDYNNSNSSAYTQNRNQNRQPFYNDSNTDPMSEDWLTLNLNPLLESSGFAGDDNQWLAAFGPETHNNLEVLGKLVNEPYRGDVFGGGNMGFGGVQN